MIHYHAAQLASTGKWHYIAGGNPTGYCSRFLPCPSCRGDSFGAHLNSEYYCTTCESKGAVLADAPCPGHDTADEAREHYRQYLLDHRLELDRMKLPGMQLPCQACGAWTQRLAQVGDYQSWPLCDEHRTRDVVDGLLVVGESWES